MVQYWNKETFLVEFLDDYKKRMRKYHNLNETIISAQVEKENFRKIVLSVCRKIQKKYIWHLYDQIITAHTFFE